MGREFGEEYDENVWNLATDWSLGGLLGGVADQGRQERFTRDVNTFLDAGQGAGTTEGQGGTASANAPDVLRPDTVAGLHSFVKAGLNTPGAAGTSGTDSGADGSGQAETPGGGDAQPPVNGGSDPVTGSVSGEVRGSADKAASDRADWERLKGFDQQTQDVLRRQQERENWDKLKGLDPETQKRIHGPVLPVGGPVAALPPGFPSTPASAREELRPCSAARPGVRHGPGLHPEVPMIASIPFRALLLALALACPGVASAQDKQAAQAPQQAAQQAQQPQEHPDSWKLVLQRNYEELQYQIDYVDGVSQNLPGMVSKTRQDLNALRKKLDELMVLTKVSGSSPVELRAVLAGLDILKAKVEAVTQPFAKADQDLRNFQERMGELEGEFSRQHASGPQEDAQKTLNEFLGDLRKLKGKLGRVKTVLDQGLAPTRDIQGGIGKLSQAIKERIPRAWKDYYLSQGKGFLTAGAWREAAQRVQDLPRLVATYLSLFNSGEARLLDVLPRLGGLAAVFCLAAFLILRRARERMPDLPPAREFGFFVWIALGVATLWATAGPAFIMVRAESGAVAEILLSRGLLGFSRLLGAKGSGGGFRRGDGLGVAWLLFVLACLFQLPWLPEAPRGAIWVLLLLGAGWLARRSASAGDKSLGARLAQAGGWLYPLLCLPALLGWVNMTLLAVMAWFLLLAFLQAGVGLHALAARAASTPREDLPGECARLLLAGLALPAVALAMAGCWLFWLSMSMGGNSVFMALVGQDVGEEGFSLDLAGAAGLFAGFFLAKAVTRVAHRLVVTLPARYPGLELGVVNLLETMATYVIWGVYALAALRMVGAGFTSLAVVAGGLSVGVGFGLQNIINNFISGLILLFGRAVQAGDVLQIGDTWGVVQRVNIRNTVVQTFDNATLFVPNSELIAQKILNWSHNDRRIRRHLDVGVGYGSDTALVQGLLAEAVSGAPGVLARPAPSVQLRAFGPQGMVFRVLFWVDDLDNASRAVSGAHLAVERILREHQVPLTAPVAP